MAFCLFDWNGDPIALLKFLFSPPGSPLTRSELQNFIPFGSILFYCMWTERNNVLHANKEADSWNFLNIVSKNFEEHSHDEKEELLEGLGEEETSSSSQGKQRNEDNAGILCIHTDAS